MLRHKFVFCYPKNKPPPMASLLPLSIPQVFANMLPFQRTARTQLRHTCPHGFPSLGVPRMRKAGWQGSGKPRRGMHGAGRQTWAGQRWVGRPSVSTHPKAAGAGKCLRARATAGSSPGSATGSCGMLGHSLPARASSLPSGTYTSCRGVRKKALWTLATNITGQGPEQSAWGALS